LKIHFQSILGFVDLTLGDSRHCGTNDTKDPWDSKIFSLKGFKENLGLGSYVLSVKDLHRVFGVWSIHVLDGFRQFGTLGFKVQRSSRAVSRV
jgi:hypothetical protein